MIAPWRFVTDLILAEAGNLLMMRPPEQNVEDWKSHAASIRQAGGERYQAAKNKNFDLAHQKYVTLISNCNSCHDQFHNGKPNLKP